MSLATHWDILRGSYTWDNTLTSFDISNIWNLSDEEIISYVESEIWLSLDSDEAIEKINKIFKKSLNYLREHLLYTNKEIGKVRHTIFRSKNDVVSFLRQTKSKKWIINCVLGKVAEAINDSDTEFNEVLDTIQQKTKQVLDNKLMKWLHLRDVWNDEMTWYICVDRSAYDVQFIEFKVKKRLKSSRSLASKEIRKPKYHTIERHSDLYGATFETESKEELLPLMQYVADLVFKKWIYYIKNDTEMFSPEDIVENSFLRDDFKGRVLSGTIPRDEEWSWDVQSIKITTPYFKDDASKNLSLELMFQVSEHENEYGLNMHGIYDYKKKIIERVRLEWSVGIEYFRLLAEHFISHLQDNLDRSISRKDKNPDTYKKELFSELRELWLIWVDWDLRNNHIKANLDSILTHGLVDYFKSKFIPVRYEGGKKIRYTTKRGIAVNSENIGIGLDELSL